MIAMNDGFTFNIPAALACVEGVPLAADEVPDGEVPEVVLEAWLVVCFGPCVVVTGFTPATEEVAALPKLAYAALSVANAAPAEPEKLVVVRSRSNSY
jgi:hypothetical protein